eukprot:8152188-Pyramimonas_sp.AAC.1
MYSKLLAPHGAPPTVSPDWLRPRVYALFSRLIGSQVPGICSLLSPDWLRPRVYALFSRPIGSGP